MARAEVDDYSGLLVLLFIAVIIIGCSGLCYVLEFYKFHPSWGPKQKTEANGDETLRVNQIYIHGHMKNWEETAFQDQGYGSLGGDHRGVQAQLPPLWGECEAPWQRREKVWHPELGEVIVKHGFADTQWLRTHSSWWPRDEPHFNREAGVSSHPLTINDESAKLIRHQLGSPRCA
mmetsp:Transcript_109168/g.284624  ORF Transcript_109168/g.284624 Transcript_109168/m.284624 type:complete len:176 (-) Transcript_109168:47-574(-)